MTVKKISLTGLLLSSVFLVACQPQETANETDTMMIEETNPAAGEERIIMEGTDQAIPGEEEMYLENSETMTEETPSPMIEGEAEVETEANM